MGSKPGICRQPRKPRIHDAKIHAARVICSSERGMLLDESKNFEFSKHENKKTKQFHIFLEDMDTGIAVLQGILPLIDPTRT